RRNVFAIIGDLDLVKLLLTDIAKRMAGRKGGNTRIIHAGKRHGDNAAMAILELTELKEKVKKEPKAKKEKKAAKPSAKETKKTEVKAEDKESAKSKKNKDAGEAAGKEPTGTESGDEKGFLGGLRKFLKQDKAE
ncbi:MAG: L17 family ribosomal protein, partial [Candidatus Omnitrophica bacterium]|nr:L17 family ribosomal protein [Candidatus Omnitrophota bacterium]